jgi:hypothetical protein
MTYEKMLANMLPPGLDAADYEYDHFLDVAFDLAIETFGKKKAKWLFHDQEDFVGDLISAYQNR